MMHSDNQLLFVANKNGGALIFLFIFEANNF